jgi:hypothetical protein
VSLLDRYVVIDLENITTNFFCGSDIYIFFLCVLWYNRRIIGPINPTKNSPELYVMIQTDLGLLEYSSQMFRALRYVAMSLLLGCAHVRVIRYGIMRVWLRLHRA